MRAVPASGDLADCAPECTDCCVESDEKGVGRAVVVLTPRLNKAPEAKEVQLPAEGSVSTCEY